jgi:glutathione S-transferase
MRVYRIPYSTNVERVALALAHKSIPVDWVDVDPDDRSAVVALSGQDLVPVMQTDHGEVVAPKPDQRRLHDLSDELRGWLHLFEEMLDGRDWLMGEAFGAADICAFPFLKYGVLELRPDDTDPFHRVLSEHLPITGAFPEIEAWVHRVDALPRA